MNRKRTSNTVAVSLAGALALGAAGYATAKDAPNPLVDAADARNGNKNVVVNGITDQENPFYRWNLHGSSDGRGTARKLAPHIPQGYADVDLKGVLPRPEDQTTSYKSVSVKDIINLWEADVARNPHSDMARNAARNIAEAKAGILGKNAGSIDDAVLARANEALVDGLFEKSEQFGLPLGDYGIVISNKDTNGKTQASVYGIFHLGKRINPEKIIISGDAKTDTLEYFIHNNKFIGGVRIDADGNASVVAGFETESFTVELEGLYELNNKGRTSFTDPNGPSGYRSLSTDPDRTYGALLNFGVKVDDKWRLFAGAGKVWQNINEERGSWRVGDVDHNLTSIINPTNRSIIQAAVGYTPSGKDGRFEAVAGARKQEDRDTKIFGGVNVKFGSKNQYNKRDHRVQHRN